MSGGVAVLKKLNPYSKEYFESELKVVTFKEHTIGSASVSYEERDGRIDGYMYRTHGKLPEFPVLSINDVTWMSLTPMEVESHYVPIQRAKGRVVTGGLGLGYFTQRVLVKEAVDTVVAYEMNPDVIALYLENFGEHPKLEIRQGDILEMQGETFDFAFIDIYDAPGDELAPTHMSLLTAKNSIGEYRFWTMEQVMLEMIYRGYIEELRPEWVDDATELGLYMLKHHAAEQQLRGNGSYWYKRFCDAGLL